MLYLNKTKKKKKKKRKNPLQKNVSGNWIPSHWPVVDYIKADANKSQTDVLAPFSNLTPRNNPSNNTANYSQRRPHYNELHNRYSPYSRMYYNVRNAWITPVHCLG